MGRVRCITLVIVSFIIATLAACGINQSGLSQLALSANRVEIDTGNELVYSIAQYSSGSDIVLCGKAVGDGCFCVLSSDSSGEIGAFFFPENEVCALTGTGNGVIWTLYETGNGTYAIEGFSGTGQSMAFLELELPAEQVSRVVGMRSDRQNNLYICWGLSGGRTAVTALSSELEIMYTIENDGDCYGFAMSGDTPCCLMSGNRLKLVDAENRDWGEMVKLDLNIVSVFSADDGQLLLSGDDSGIYSYSLSGDELALLFSLSEHFIDGYVLAAAKLGLTEYAVVTQTEFYVFTEHSAEEPDERKVITMVSDGLSSVLTEKVLEFNDTNEDYRIELEVIENETLFTTRLLAGEVPDIFYFSSVGYVLDAETLGRAGYLADLYDFIDSDSGLGRDSFVPNIIEASEHDGVLWQLPISFNIDVMAADSSIASDIVGLTFTELRDLLDRIGFDGNLFGPSMDRSFVLYKLLSVNIDCFVNWNAGEAKFDSQEFQNLLYICKEYAPEEGYDDGLTPREWVENGEMLFRWDELSTICEVQRFDYFFDDPVLIGFPTADGLGNALVPQDSFAISASTEYRQAVWDFVRSFYLPEFYYEAFSTNGSAVCFPVNAQALEAKLSNPEIDIREAGIILETDRYTITITEPTQRDIDVMSDVIYSINKTSRYDSSISNIINEEAAAYFAGDKTVEETTRLIQSRVQLYLGEQS